MDQEKRQEIIRKVLALYLQYGIRSVTMDDVVREVGISKKTLYQYFTDKSELVDAVVDCDSNLKIKEHDDATDKIVEYILQTKSQTDAQRAKGHRQHSAADPQTIECQ